MSIFSQDKSVGSMRSLVFFSVCIVTFRRPLLLANCLECIDPSRQTLHPSLYEVIVSDDCQDCSAKNVVKNFSFARWIQGPARGVAANRNHISRAAYGKWIIFVDDDELPQPDWLEKIYEAAYSGEWDVIEGRVEPVNYPDNLLWYAPRVSKGGTFCTANLAILRQALFDLGGFDEKMSISHEDIELGFRIVRADLRTVYLSDALVIHPARRMNIKQVWHRMIQQQCQCFDLIHVDDCSRLNAPLGVFYLAGWLVRFWFIVLRLEWTSKPRGHWKRQLQAYLLSALTLPVAACSIWRSRTDRR
ncbi:MAG: glycosyltransferase family 2 protein [Cyanobacteriota bacterium]